MESYSLKKFFQTPLPFSYLPYTLLGLSLLGLLDAVYLTIVHYRNLIPPCTIGGCEVVLTSKYAMVGPFPTSLYGVAFYLSVIVLTALFIQVKTKWLPGLLFVMCLSGLVVGIFLVYLQAFVLHSFCQYCLASEVIDFLMFDTAWWLYNSYKERSLIGESR